jgi:hypothetical protein
MLWECAVFRDVSSLNVPRGMVGVTGQANGSGFGEQESRGLENKVTNVRALRLVKRKLNRNEIVVGKIHAFHGGFTIEARTTWLSATESRCLLHQPAVGTWPSMHHSHLQNKQTWNTSGRCWVMRETIGRPFKAFTLTGMELLAGGL